MTEDKLWKYGPASGQNSECRPYEFSLVQAENGWTIQSNLPQGGAEKIRIDVVNHRAGEFVNGDKADKNGTSVFLIESDGTTYENWIGVEQYPATNDGIEQACKEMLAFWPMVDGAAPPSDRAEADQLSGKLASVINAPQRPLPADQRPDMMIVAIGFVPVRKPETAEEQRFNEWFERNKEYGMVAYTLAGNGKVIAAKCALGLPVPQPYDYNPFPLDAGNPALPLENWPIMPKRRPAAKRDLGSIKPS
ncbi:MAG: hypothetical protein KGI97_03595 [Alphaproteobacteria bacterium]|nr:hypothetical protein [Alphaproteobacteria bacterium]